VPAFIFLSGYVHAKKYRQYSDVLGFYRRRFRSIVVPYLFVSGCYTLYAVLSPSHPGFGSLQNYLFLFFVSGVDGPLYFVPVIVQFYLLFPLLARVFSSSDSSDKNWIKLFLLSIGFHVLSGLLTYKGLLPFLVIRSSFIFWGPYFCAGMLVGFGRISKGPVHCLKRLAIPFLLAALALLYWAITAILWPFVLREFAFAYMRPVLMMYNAICVWLIALIILEGPQASNRFFGWLGKNSLIIFLWHVPVLRVLLNVTPVDANTAIATYFPFIPLIILAALMITGLGSAAWETTKVRAGSYLGNLF
jgi:peptidoglycan/LPS O-acetylase OafA/YrhL